MDISELNKATKFVRDLDAVMVSKKSDVRFTFSPISFGENSNFECEIYAYCQSHILNGYGLKYAVLVFSGQLDSIISMMSQDSGLLNRFEKSVIQEVGCEE